MVFLPIVALRTRKCFPSFFQRQEMLVKIAIFLLRSPQISTPCQPSLRAKNGDGLNSIKLFQFDVKYDSQTYMEKKHRKTENQCGAVVNSWNTIRTYSDFTKRKWSCHSNKQNLAVIPTEVIPNEWIVSNQIIVFATCWKEICSERLFRRPKKRSWGEIIAFH